MVHVFYVTKKRWFADSPMSVVMAFLIFLFFIYCTLSLMSGHTHPGPT